MSAHLHIHINKMILGKAGGFQIDLNISMGHWPLNYDKYADLKVRICILFTYNTGIFPLPLGNNP